MKVLPTINLKIVSICQGCKHQLGKFQLQCMAAKNGFSRKWLQTGWYSGT